MPIPSLTSSAFPRPKRIAARSFASYPNKDEAEAEAEETDATDVEELPPPRNHDQNDKELDLGNPSASASNKTPEEIDVEKQDSLESETDPSNRKIDDDSEKQSDDAEEGEDKDEENNEESDALQKAMAAPFPHVPTWQLTLVDSVHLGITNNRDVAVLQPAPKANAAAVSFERGDFDPVFGLSVFGGEDDRQVRSEIQNFGAKTNYQNRDFFKPVDGLNQIYLKQRLMNGGSYEIGVGTDYQRFVPAGSELILPSAWESSININYIQPLLRGRGKAAATVKLRVAQAKQEQSQYEFYTELREIVRDIDIAYWELAGARRRLDVAKRYVRLGEIYNEQEIERGDLGLSAKPQQIQAMTLLGDFIISAAQAKVEVDVSEMKLRRLLGIADQLYADNSLCSLESNPEIGLPIEPVYDVNHLDEPTDLSAAISHAMSRPEIVFQQAKVKEIQYRLAAAKNSLLPDIKAYTQYQQLGLAKELDSSSSTVFDGDYELWGVGITYERRLTQRSERADVRRLSYLLCQEQAQARKVSHDIVGQLRETKAFIDTARATIEAREAQLEKLAEQVEIYNELYKENRVSLFERVQFATRLQEAELSLIQDWTLLQANQAQWRFARGDNADTCGIELSNGRTYL
ncbi:TolC family protein [Novipirellula herctigrandis]|uniref:TolC family protein n=1 Tax=Novipirellula herctigrandis TaxID=2527986 RepID=UPI003AF3E99D